MAPLLRKHRIGYGRDPQLREMIHQELLKPEGVGASSLGLGKGRDGGVREERKQTGNSLYAEFLRGS